MTTITITKDFIEVSGHSGYADYGADIVCASVSMATQMLYNVLECEAEIDHNGYMKLYTNDRSKVTTTYIEMMKELSRQYKEHIEVRS